jgi:hypothetical protein
LTRVKGAVPALLFAIAAVGCGGGSTETGTHAETQQRTQPRSRADYIALADVICKNHQSRREDLESQARELGPLTSKAKAREAGALLRKEADNRRAEVGELRGLQLPAADAATIHSILSLVGAETNMLDRWAAAYYRLDERAIRRLQIRLGLTAGRAADRARAYGFEVCGQQ